MADPKKLELMALVLFRHLDEETDRLFTMLEDPLTDSHPLCDKIAHVGNLVEVTCMDSDILNYVNGKLKHSYIIKGKDTFTYELPEKIRLVVKIAAVFNGLVNYTYEVYQNTTELAISFGKVVGVEDIQDEPK